MSVLSAESARIHSQHSDIKTAPERSQASQGHLFYLCCCKAQKIPVCVQDYRHDDTAAPGKSQAENQTQHYQLKECKACHISCEHTLTQPDREVYHQKHQCITGICYPLAVFFQNCIQKHSTEHRFFGDTDKNSDKDINCMKGRTYTEPSVLIIVTYQQKSRKEQNENIHGNVSESFFHISCDFAFVEIHGIAVLPDNQKSRNEPEQRFQHYLHDDLDGNISQMRFQQRYEYTFRKRPYRIQNKVEYQSCGPCFLYCSICCSS